MEIKIQVFVLMSCHGPKTQSPRKQNFTSIHMSLPFQNSLGLIDSY